MMHARMNHPVMVVPDAMKPLQTLGELTKNGLSEKLVELVRRHYVPLRQSYRRVAKRAAIMVGRYTHAHQFKRARRELKFLRIRLDRVTRDIRPKIANDEALSERFADLLALAVRVRFQDHRERGPQGLFAARPRGRVHRQRQGSGAL